MQFIKITTTPMEYTLEVKHASLEVAEKQPGQEIPLQQSVKAQHRVRRDAGFSPKRQESKPHEVTIPLYGPGTTTAPDGASATELPEGERVAPIAETLDSVIAQIPSGTVDRSWEPEVEMLEPATPLADNKREMEYHPGDVSIDIKTMPKVDIEYIGSLPYFPKSSAPDYEPAE